MKSLTEQERLNLKTFYNSLVFLIHEKHINDRVKNLMLTEEKQILDAEIIDIMACRKIRILPPDNVNTNSPSSPSRNKASSLATQPTFATIPPDLRSNFETLINTLNISRCNEDAPFADIKFHLDKLFPSWEELIEAHLFYPQIQENKSLIRYFLYFLDMLLDVEQIEELQEYKKNNQDLVHHTRIASIKTIVKNKIINAIKNTLTNTIPNLEQQALSFLESLPEEFNLLEDRQFVYDIYNRIISDIAKNLIQVKNEDMLNNILWQSQAADFFSTRFLDEKGLSIVQHATISGQKVFLHHLLQTYAPHWLHEIYIGNQVHLNGGNLLHLACFYKQKKCLKELLIKKNVCRSHSVIDPNSQTLQEGLTPLHIAVINAKDENDEISYEIISVLLESETTKIDFQDLKGKSAIHYAILKKDKKILDLLMQKQANIGLLTHKQSSVLHIVSQKGNYEDLLYLFVKYGTQVQYLINTQDANGNTPLHLVIQNPQQGIKSVQLLLTQLAEPLIINKAQEKAYDIAKKNDLIHIMSLLPNENKNNNNKLTNSKTMLRNKLTQSNKEVSIPKILLEESPLSKKSFNIDKPTITKLPELPIANNLGLPSLLEYQNASEQRPDILFLNNLNHDLQFLNSPDIRDNTDDYRAVTLIDAIKTKKHSVFNYLFSFPEIYSDRKKLFLILYNSAKYNNTQVIDYLLSKEEKLRFDATLILQTDDYGMSPIYYAGYYGQQEVLRMFLSYTQAQQYPNILNRTLYYAILGNNPGIVKYLLSGFPNFIDPLAIDSKQENQASALSALHIASILNPELFLLLCGFLKYKGHDIFTQHRQKTLHVLHLIYFYGREELLYRSASFIESIHNNSKRKNLTNEDIINLIQHASSEQIRELNCYDCILTNTQIDAIYLFEDTQGRTPVFYGMQNNNISSTVFENVTDKVFDWAIEFDRENFVEKYFDKNLQKSSDIATMKKAFDLATKNRSTKSLIILIKKLLETKLLEQNNSSPQTEFTHAKVLAGFGKHGLYNAIEYYLSALKPQITSDNMLSLIEACASNGYLHVIFMLKAYFEQNYVPESTIKNIYSAGIRQASEKQMLRTLEHLLSYDMETEDNQSQNITKIHIRDDYSQPILELLSFNYFTVTKTIYNSSSTKNKVTPAPLSYATYGHSINFIRQTLRLLAGTKNFNVIKVICDACCNLLPNLWMYSNLLTIDHMNQVSLFSFGNDSYKGTLLAEIIKMHSDTDNEAEKLALYRSIQTLFQVYPQQINFSHDVEKKSALHLAVKYQNIQILEFLLTYCNTLSVTQDATQDAIQNEYLNVYNQVDVMNDPLEIRDEYGLTALNLACELFLDNPIIHSTIIKTLLSHKADMNTLTQNNITPIHYLCHHALNTYDSDAETLAVIRDVLDNSILTQYLSSINLQYHMYNNIFIFYIIKFHLLTNNFGITDGLYVLAKQDNQNTFDYKVFLDVIQFHLGCLLIKLEQAEETIETYFITETLNYDDMLNLYKTFHQKYNTDLTLLLTYEACTQQIYSVSIKKNASSTTFEILKLLQNKLDNAGMIDIIKYSSAIASRIRCNSFFTELFEQHSKIVCFQKSNHELIQDILRCLIINEQFTFATHLVKNFGANINESKAPYGDVLDMMNLLLVEKLNILYKAGTSKEDADACSREVEKWSIVIEDLQRAQAQVNEIKRSEKEKPITEALPVQNQSNTIVTATYLQQASSPTKKIRSRSLSFNKLGFFKHYQNHKLKKESSDSSESLDDIMDVNKIKLYVTDYPHISLECIKSM